MRTRGFSLLEVMIAVAILGLVLTVILSAQGGLAASNQAASNLGNAITAARCKMTEQEEKLVKFGYQELDQVDTDVPCCEDAEPNGITCDVRTVKIELPNPPQNSLGDGGAGLSLGGADGGMGGALGAITGAAGGSGLNLSMDGGLQGFGAGVQAQMGLGGAAALAGGAAGAMGGMGAGEGLLQMVMGIAYPGIKPLMEASIRRITVTAKWKEGPNARTFAIVQYVTNPQRGGFMDLMGADGGGLPMGGFPGAGAIGGLPGAAGGAAGTTGGVGR